MNYPLPANERARLQVLQELRLPDTIPEPALDDLTALAAELCEMPIALISIIDEQRQWFKSRVGVDLLHTPREQAFCNYTICQTELFIVPDVLADERFAENPLVVGGPQIRFYAGAPLLSRDGHAVGTLCVIDRVPRTLSADQQRTLRVLSRHVTAQLELRRQAAIDSEAGLALVAANASLERSFAQRTAQLQVAVKQAEAAKLHISNMVERMSDGMVALDAQWRFDYVNSKAAELIGRAPTELLGERFTDVFPQAARLPFLREIEEAVREQKPWKSDVFYQLRRVWFEVRCYPSAEGISFFFQDISNRKVAEGKLDHERALSETIIASLPGTFYLFDEQGKYLRWNDQAEAATGLVGDDFRRMHPLNTIAAEDRARVEREIERTFADGSAVVEARVRHHGTGEERWHLLTGRRISVDQQRCLLGVGIDISDRKAAELALEDARSHLEVAVRASGIGFWRWEIASNQTYVSGEFRRQLGFDESVPLDDQTFWLSRVHPDDVQRIHEFSMQRLQDPTQVDSEQEYRIRHCDGAYHWVLSRSRLHFDAAGRPERMLGCHIDITERRSMEEAIRASEEQLRALAEHLHSVREEEARRIARELHDEMGSSLTALKMDLGWLDRQLARLVEAHTSEPLRARLADINLQLDGTLDSMRKVCHALRPAVLDQLGLAAAIDWQCAEFQGRSGVHCRVERDDSLALDDAKSTAVFRILQELLTNVTRHARATEVSVKARCVEEAYHLTVSDNGCGLPADAFARDRSFGLVGVRERALAAGGRASFEKSAGGGTTVEVCIPLPPEETCES